jgi:uncharacterized membrane protein YfcA
MLESLSLGLLFLAAVAAGVVNAVAGGGTLLTFPSLIRFGGFSAVVSNATNTVAMVPGSLAGAWGFRRELRGAGPWLTLLLGPSLLGGILGALLVTRLPDTVFAQLVPWLLLTASLLFLFQPRLGRLLPARPHDELPAPKVCALVMGFQFLVAVYGGYFGAGIGILMLTALGFIGLGDIHRMNAIKAILAAVINGASILVFVIERKVEWQPALLMSCGAILGGFTGASLGRRLPPAVVRWFVVTVGLVLSAYYFAGAARLL